MNALKTSKELTSFARRKGIRIDKDMWKRDVIRLLLKKDLIFMEGGVAHIKTKRRFAGASPALQPPSPLDFRQRPPKEDYERFVKNNMRHALTELGRKRWSVIPNYDAKTYVSESVLPWPEDDNSCDHMFCAFGCSKI